jgi:flagellin-like protein
LTDKGRSLGRRTFSAQRGITGLETAIILIAFVVVASIFAYTGDFKKGAAALTLTVASGFGSGLVAYENLGSTVDLSAHFAASLWIKSGTTLAAVACVGIAAASDPGAVTLQIDRFQGPPGVQSLQVAMNNTIPRKGHHVHPDGKWGQRRAAFRRGFAVAPHDGQLPRP